MKKRTILSLIFAIALCFSSLFVTIASAYEIGDVNGDKKVNSSDARTALRASVNLQKLSTEQFTAADVNFDGKVNASDARKILRASVNLEQLHTHKYTTVKVEKAATCTAKGEQRTYCSCGKYTSKELAIIPHSYTDLRVDKAATCIKKGEGKTYCVCGKYIKTEIPLTDHKINVKITTDAKCQTPSCNFKIPAFNTLVNSLKASDERNYFYGFTKTTTTTEKAKATAKNTVSKLYVSEIQDMLNENITEGSKDEYTAFINNRYISKNTFAVQGQDYVSGLKDEDIKSISATRMTDIDFIKNLPDSYVTRVSGTVVDLTKIKASKIGDVYKIRVELKPEKATSTALPKDNSPIERIISSTYNDGLILEMRDLEKEFSDLKDFFAFKSELTTTCTVDYYFTADKFEPVCALYNTQMTTKNTINIRADLLLIKIDVDVNASNNQQNYYFFNKHFTVE